MSVGSYFSDEQWNVASLALHRACDITLTPLRQLMMAFTAGSHSFYGDSNQVLMKYFKKKNWFLNLKKIVFIG